MLNLLRKNIKRWFGAPTFLEMFELYKKEKFPEISKSTQNGYLMAIKHSKRLYDMVFSEIKYADLTMVINDVKEKGHGYSTKKKVKVLFTQMYTYALVNEYVEKDYARFVKSGEIFRYYREFRLVMLKLKHFSIMLGVIRTPIQF